MRFWAFFVIIILAQTLTVKLNYDPKKGYSYSVQGPSAEEVIDAEVKIKNYIRKGKIPPVKKEESSK